MGLLGSSQRDFRISRNASIKGACLI